MGLVDTPILTGNDCEGAGETFSLAEGEAFFRRPTYLTVSAQLHLEAMALGLSRVFCLGRAFRAEKSLTTYHLAEFSMLEAEATELDTTDRLCDHVEWLLKNVTKELLSNSAEDLALIARETALTVDSQQQQQQQHLSMVEGLVARPFIRLSFADAVRQLLQLAAAAAASDSASASSATSTTAFESPPTPGMTSLRREHELALVRLCGQRPVFITDWPAGSRPFYTAAAAAATDSGAPPLAAGLDLLLPGVGEVVGGGVREPDADRLAEAMLRRGLDAAALERLAWYLDIRRLGGAPHGGYGLGLERLLRFVTGVTGVKELVPFPRSFTHCHA